MRLHKKKHQETLDRFWQEFSRDNVPLGAGKKKRTILGAPKTGRNGRGVAFSLEGDCQGPLLAVMELGLRLAKVAMDQEQDELAERILERVESLPREYELKKQIAQLKGMQTRMLKQVK